MVFIHKIVYTVTHAFVSDKMCLLDDPFNASGCTWCFWYFCSFNNKEPQPPQQGYKVMPASGRDFHEPLHMQRSKRTSVSCSWIVATFLAVIGLNSRWMCRHTPVSLSHAQNTEKDFLSPYLSPLATSSAFCHTEVPCIEEMHANKVASFTVNSTFTSYRTVFIVNGTFTSFRTVLGCVNATGWDSL